MSFVLGRVFLRYLARHGLHVVLMLAGVALGVGVVVAIDLASEGTRRSFEDTQRSLQGRATWQIVGGPAGLDETLVPRLACDLAIHPLAPVIDRPVELVEPRRRTMHLLGVDLFSERPFRAWLDRSSGVDGKALSALLCQPGAVLVASSLARESGVGVGGKLVVESGGRRSTLTIAGLVASDEVAGAAASLIVADIATAQEVLRLVGRVDRIDLRLDASQASGREALERVRSALPPGTRVVEAASRTASVRQMTAALELNLRAISLLAVLVGVFLVYNTVTFFVLQRRPLLGTLRALGATRGQVFSAVMLETMLLGAVGTAMGLGVGVLLGQGALRLVTRTVNDLYYVVSGTSPLLTSATLLQGAAVGMVASLASALVPALEASRVQPVSAMRRSDLELGASRLGPRLACLGAVLVVAGLVVACLPSRRLDLAFVSALLMFGGAALAVPLLLAWLTRLLSWGGGFLPGVVARLAPRNVARSSSRTSVAAAALMVAVSVIVGTGIMIGSFRQTFVEWLEAALNADVYVSTPANHLSVADPMDPTVADEIAAMPGVAQVRSVRMVRLDDPRYGHVNLMAVEGDGVSSRRFTGGAPDVEAIRRRWEDGAVMVSESFAWRHDIGPGRMRIDLPTDHGSRSLDVAAIYHDYGTDQGSVLMTRRLYRSLWGDATITSVAVKVAPGVDSDDLAARIRQRFEGRLSLVVQPERKLREGILQIFERTFTITSALRLIVGLVAFIGVLGALMSLQLERTREIGVLRAVGMTVPQVWAMILGETATVGTVAGLLAMPLGLGLGWVLVYVVHPRSFGWTMAFVPHPWHFAEGLLVAVVASLLAGVWPAVSFGRISPAEAVRME